VELAEAEAAERPAVEGLADALPAGSPLHPLAIAGRARATREQIQEESLKRLSERLPGLPRVTLPLLFAAELGRGQVESLSEPFKP
jgi:hypothetical protein